MLIEDWNRHAVIGLLADAERTIALINVEDIRRNPEIVPDVIPHARQNYIDLVRQSRPLVMTDDQHNTFQSALEHIRDALRFFGESV